jgi:hypothetical protein
MQHSGESNDADPLYLLSATTTDGTGSMTYVLPARDVDLVSYGKMGATRTCRADDENLALFVHCASFKKSHNRLWVDGLPCFYTLQSTLPPSHIDIPLTSFLAVGFSRALDLLAAFQPMPPRAASCVEALEDGGRKYPALPMLERKYSYTRQFIPGFSLPGY